MEQSKSSASGACALVCFLLLSGTALGQNFGPLNFFVCPTVRSHADNANDAADRAGIDALFDPDKNADYSRGLIEGNRNARLENQMAECRRASKHCLLVRIALPISEVCHGFGFPKEVEMKIPGRIAQVNERQFRTDQGNPIPVEIKLH